MRGRLREDDAKTTDLDQFHPKMCRNKADKPLELKSREDDKVEESVEELDRDCDEGTLGRTKYGYLRREDAQSKSRSKHIQ